MIDPKKIDLTLSKLESELTSLKKISAIKIELEKSKAEFTATSKRFDTDIDNKILLAKNSFDISLKEIQSNIKTNKRLVENEKIDLLRTTKQFDKVISDKISNAIKDFEVTLNEIKSQIKSNTSFVEYKKTEIDKLFEIQNNKQLDLASSLETRISIEIDSRKAYFDKQLKITRKLQVFIIFVFITLFIIHYLFFFK